MKKKQYMKAALCALLMAAAGCGDTLDKAYDDVVKPVRVTGVQLPAFSFGAGLTRTVAPVFAPLNPSDAKFTLESSDSSVLQVSGNDVTGVKNGTATLTLTSDDGGFTASAQIEVLNIYVAGYGNTPGYWKNGVWTALAPEGNVVDLVVDGTGNLFVAGNNGGTADGYWKNGVLTLFHGGSFDGTLVFGIAIDADRNVVCAGYRFYDGDNGCGYWKNGEWNGLGTHQDSAICIAFDPSGNLVVGGTCGYPSVPGYWKNGTWQSLPQIDTTQSSSVSNIAYDSRGNLYVGGYNRLSDIPGYWKNGIWTVLPVPAGAARSWGWTVQIDSHDSVYVPGYVYIGGEYIPCYWKDGVRYELTASSRQRCTPQGMTVSANGDIIIVGIYDDNDKTKPMMWFNGEIVDLELPAGATMGDADYVAISLY